MGTATDGIYQGMEELFMKAVGLVFILKHGSNSQIIMPEPSARNIIRDWQQGTLKGFVGSTTDPYPWMVSVDCIQAIQMVPLQNQPQEEMNVLPNKLPPGCSGLQQKGS